MVLCKSLGASGSCLEGEGVVGKNQGVLIIDRLSRNVKVPRARPNFHPRRHGIIHDIVSCP